MIEGLKMDWNIIENWPYLIFGYICGSIAFGLLLTRIMGAGDLRSIGSGNIGATNVLRTGRKGLAAATLLLDLLKGTAAVLIAQYFLTEGNLMAGLAAGLGAFLGHLYPVWLKFKGGKGVATYAGIAFGICWPVGLVFAAIWIGTLLLFRISSLAGLMASIAAPLSAYYWGGPKISIMLFICTLLTIWRHRENIRRLLSGQEPKIGNKSKTDNI